MKKSILLNNKTENSVSLEDFTQNWRVLIDTLPYATIVVDTDFNVVMANNAARNLLGYPGNLQNVKCYQLFHNAGEPISNCPIEKTLASGKDEQTEIYEPTLGKHLIINSAPVFRNEEIIGFIHSFLDITNQRENEKNNNDLIDIFAGSINELKARQIGAQKGRDAFLNMLEDISESYKELEDLFLKLILVMVNALDAKSPWTKGHSERVKEYPYMRSR